MCTVYASMYVYTHVHMYPSIHHTRTCAAWWAQSVCIHVCLPVCLTVNFHTHIPTHTYCLLYNNWGQRKDFQQFLVPVYYWKTVEKQATDPQLLCKRLYVKLYHASELQFLVTYMCNCECACACKSTHARLYIHMRAYIHTLEKIYQDTYGHNEGQTCTGPPRRPNMYGPA